MFKAAASLLLLSGALASPAANLEERQANCPPIHVFGARETTVSPGYGTSAVVVNLVLNAHSGATAEPINYPACGGQSSCGGISYANSVQQGVAAVKNAVNSFNSRCPDTEIVLVGYSQGGQIFDNALCGGGDPNNGISDTSVQFQASAVNMIKAAIFMGDPRYVAGLPYNVGSCQTGGFAARPSGFQCPSANKIKSYCDSPDPYCCNGNDGNTHQGYGQVYGQQALNFINSQLGSTTPPPTTTGGNTNPTNPPGNGGGTVPQWGQCGGQGWTGGTVCVSPFTCQANNPWYSQCL